MRIPPTLPAACTKSAIDAVSFIRMRNTIAVTADRPIPLPDRILSDGWWLVARPTPTPVWERLGIVGRGEGERDRDSGERAAERTEPIRT